MMMLNSKKNRYIRQQQQQPYTVRHAKPYASRKRISGSLSLRKPAPKCRHKHSSAGTTPNSPANSHGVAVGVRVLQHTDLDDTTGADTVGEVTMMAIIYNKGPLRVSQQDQEGRAKELRFTSKGTKNHHHLKKR
uniref:Uncharacterized protein n=1 Tax=Anopheles coluzzii TaxID=1518534 RepID=A0A8W7PW95_ANOCL